MYQNHLRAMADYNRSLNQQFYALAEQLDDAERKAQRGAFFGSIHLTLNHLLLADRIWMGRFQGKEIPASSLDDELFTDFHDLKASRIVFDQEIIDFVSGLDPTDLESTFSYHGIANPEQRNCPLWFALSHFFNHQTHHRGQLTTLFSQLGIDYGTTDLIAQPGYVSR